MTVLVTNSAELLHRAAPPRAVVMTMGALHEGHRTLMREARALVGDQGSVVVTNFVNPTQFGAGEDFARYPRTLDADIQACEAEGVDVVLAPSVTEVYGPGDPTDPSRITVDPGPLGDLWEGAARPGHFRGMLTVVHRLMAMTEPAFALFGEKDYQQLTLIRRMVRDFCIPVTVVGVPTVRDHDGLALSSRNIYLTPEERVRALAIPRAITVALEAQGLSRVELENVVRDELRELDAVDYASVVTRDMSGPADEGEARLVIAARVGTTRLLDNAPVWVSQG